MKTVKLSDLNFDFPIVRDIQKTRENHEHKIKKVKDEYLLLEDYSNEHLCQIVEDYGNDWYRYFLRSDNKPGQKTVKAIKTFVNNAFRGLIREYLENENLSLSWDTAYYLANQKEFDRRMKAVSKLIYKEAINN